MKKYILMFLCGTMIFSGCGMSNLGKGSLIGSGAGAAIGAGLGYLIGKDGKGAAIGAAIGTAVGGGTGAVIGNKMDKKAEELAALENAQVETVEDVNGLKAIKVTFDSGILFDFNKSTLQANAKKQLDKFAAEMADMPDTDITVLGHTDNVGSAEANQKVSDNRAKAVSSYLQNKGIAASRPRRDLHLRQREHDQGRRERNAEVIGPETESPDPAARAFAFPSFHLILSPS